MDYSELKQIIRTIIEEELIISDDTIDFVSGGEISSNFGKSKKMQAYETGARPTTEYKPLSILSVYKSKRSDDTTAALKRLKAMSVTKPESYLKFIKRSAIYIANKLLKGTDYVITPKSSHQVLSDLKTEISKIKPHLKWLDEGFLKNDVSKIKLRTDLKLSDKTVKTLRKNIDNQGGDFQMKNTPKKFAKAYYDIFDFSDTVVLDKLKDSKITILDDVLSTGASAYDMYYQFEKFGIDNVNMVTLFKQFDK